MIELCLRVGAGLALRVCILYRCGTECWDICGEPAWWSPWTIELTNIVKQKKIRWKFCLKQCDLCYWWLSWYQTQDGSLHTQKLPVALFWLWRCHYFITLIFCCFLRIVSAGTSVQFSRSEASSLLPFNHQRFPEYSMLKALFYFFLTVSPWARSGALWGSFSSSGVCCWHEVQVRAWVGNVL